MKKGLRILLKSIAALMIVIVLFFAVVFVVNIISSKAEPEED